MAREEVLSLRSSLSVANKRANTAEISLAAAKASEASCRQAAGEAAIAAAAKLRAVSEEATRAAVVGTAGLQGR